jgi:hypothetical protein
MVGGMVCRGRDTSSHDRHSPPVTRYGFAIKALPKGGQPFGDEDDDQTNSSEEGAPIKEDPTVAPPDDSFLGENPGEPANDSAAPPPGDASDGATPANEASTDAPESPVDDARPWAGDMYDEGDETEPADAFAAYTGSNGEQAWLDRAPDGTLTGWVRDGTGQVWRYTDPDAWAVDVDGAQMTRTHSQADETASSPPTPTPTDRGVQESMFQ